MGSGKPPKETWFLVVEQGVKGLLAEQFVADPAVRGFDACILPRRPRQAGIGARETSQVCERVGVSPGPSSIPMKPGARPRAWTYLEELNCFVGGDRAGYFNGQDLPCEPVDDVEHPEQAAFRGLVALEVDRPDVFGVLASRRLHSVVECPS